MDKPKTYIIPKKDVELLASALEKLESTRAEAIKAENIFFRLALKIAGGDFVENERWSVSGLPDGGLELKKIEK